MDIQFQIEKAFLQAFNIPLRERFDIPKKPANGFKENIMDTSFKPSFAVQQSQTAKLGASFYKNDAYGREYFLPASIYYTDANGASKSIDLPLPVITIQASKTIVETPLVERHGSVKEIINTDDIIINIRGVIVHPDNWFPEDDITKVYNVAFIPQQTVSIKNALTDIFLQALPGFDNAKGGGVVVKSLKFPAVTGCIGTKPYEIELVSDFIFDLENVPAV